MPVIGKPILSIQVANTYDPKTLMVIDASQYFQLQTIPGVLDIFLPGAKNPVSVYINKNSVNIFNSNNLGITNLIACNEQDYADLPDGVYCIKLTVTDDFIVQRYYLKDDSTRMRLDKMYLKASIEYDKKDMALRDSLEDIEFLLSAAHAWLRKGNFINTNKYFNQAISMIGRDCPTCL